MALAANRLGEVGGGVVIFSRGKELALVEMPIAGLMSDQRAEIVAAKAERLTAAMRQVGILAAAGLIALEDGAKRLHEDHANARRLRGERPAV